MADDKNVVPLRGVSSREGAASRNVASTAVLGGAVALGQRKTGRRLMSTVTR